MMNYIAFRLDRVPYQRQDRCAIGSSAMQTPRISHAAELWSLWDIPNRLDDPLNAWAWASCSRGWRW